MLAAFIGFALLFAGGAFIKDVPYKRFIPAVFLISTGTLFISLGAVTMGYM